MKTNPQWDVRIVEGEAHVMLADVLNWIRLLAAAWEGTRHEPPSTVANYVADLLRDAWMDMDRSEVQE